MQPKKAAPDLPTAPVTSPAAPDSSRFVLGAVEVIGTTAYPPGTFAPIYEPFLAREVSIDDVRAMAKKITDRYRQDGFFLYRAVVEPQDLAIGILRIRVVEGALEQVVFDGGREDRMTELVALGARITARKPTHIGDVERYVLLMNDLPGISAKSAVTAIDEEAGRYRLVIGLTFRRIQGFASVDNRGTRGIGPFQALVGANVNSLYSGGDRTDVTVFTIPHQPKELLFGEITHTKRIGDEGTTVSITGSQSEIDAGAPLDGIDLGSRSTRAALRVRHPLIRRQRQNLWLHGQFDTVEQRQNQEDERTFDDNIRTLRWGGDYELEDEWDGFNTASIQFSHGLGILGANGENSTNASRDRGQATFNKVWARLGRRQAIGESWAVEATIAGQYADERLLSAEEFFVGGTGFGRAYDSGEIAGDQGAAASVELQFGNFTSWAWLDSYQLYGFYDFGVVWDTATNGYVGRESLASAGGGIRLGFTEKIYGGLEVAKPLTRAVANINDQATGPRVFFYLLGNF